MFAACLFTPRRAPVCSFGVIGQFTGSAIERGQSLASDLSRILPDPLGPRLAHREPRQRRAAVTTDPTKEDDR
jgi:hypothetical protein